MGNTNIDIRKYYPNDQEQYPSREQKLVRQNYNCSKVNPCGHLPCKACGKATQSWFVRECLSAFSGKESLQCVSIVLPQHSYSDEDLSNIDLKGIARTIRDIIARADLNDRIWIGGIDLSRNTASWCVGEHHWQFQAMMLTTQLNYDEKKELRTRVNVSDEVLRPIRCKDIDDLRGIAKYALKPDFNERYSFINRREKRGTHHSALKGSHLKFLRENLCCELHQDRLITVGMRRHGNHLVEI